MVKGQACKPSTAKDGYWYQHKNCQEYLAVGPRIARTSTGSMLDVGSDSKVSRPQVPPQPFTDTERPIYKDVNPFSNLDNRNDIQMYGEYLGNAKSQYVYNRVPVMGKSNRTLGRRITDPEERLHRTESAYLKHDGKRTTDTFYHTNYQLSHTGAQSAPAELRRFSRHHPPRNAGPCRPTTTTTNQFVGSFRTRNQTLVSSLEPFVKRNTWKYAYNANGKYDIYPKVWGDRCSAHLPQSKAASHHPVVHRVQRECSKPQQCL